jgi:predicted porin
MKKSLIALAVLGAFAGAASAQSSVTIYGFIDVAAAKTYGNEDKRIVDGALTGGGSRLGFRGVEDLGGGLKAVFGFEHRLDADTGAANSASTFWAGYSTVGLVTPYGMVNLGRQYTPAFLMIQNQIDPFGGETVAQGREIGMRFGSTATTNPGTGRPFGENGQTASTVYKTRYADSIRYDITAGGFNFGASVGESSTANGVGNKAWSVAANYAAGPFWIGAGYENPGADEDKGWNVGGRWNAGFATFAAGYGRGTTATALDATSWLVGATVPVGALDIKAVYATSDIDVLGTARKIGVGVHYNFSKRTKIYADFARFGGDVTALGTAVDDNKSGYDFGIKHSF